MKNLHIINTLEIGGAQSVLVQLLEGWGDERDQQMVISLRDREQLSERLESLGIAVEHIGFLPGKINPTKFLKLIRIIRSYKPDIIQTWLYHADLIGSIAARLAGRTPIVWGVHHTTTSKQTVKASTWRIIRILSWLSSYIPSKIIFCSHSAFHAHIDIGYPKEKLIVVPNGIDSNRFQPNAFARSLLRSELKLSNNTKLIGMFARYHPQKDHHTLIRAAGVLFKKKVNVHFVLAGEDVDASNSLLQTQICEENLQDNIHLLGSRYDMPLLTAGLDIATLSSSYGEALPQTLGEAMACGIPCVATNVGDAEALIGNTGIVVAPEDSQMLADAWESILDLSDKEYNYRSNLARNRILQLYNSENMINQYKNTYKALISNEIL